MKTSLQFLFVVYNNWIDPWVFLWKYLWKAQKKIYFKNNFATHMFLHKIKSDLSTFDKPGKLLRLCYWPQHLFLSYYLLHVFNTFAQNWHEEPSWLISLLPRRRIAIVCRMAWESLKWIKNGGESFKTPISVTLTDVNKRSCHCVIIF